jgi:hypothetical protein
MSIKISRMPGHHALRIETWLLKSKTPSAATTSALAVFD